MSGEEHKVQDSNEATSAKEAQLSERPDKFQLDNGVADFSRCMLMSGRGNLPRSKISERPGITRFCG